MANEIKISEYLVSLLEKSNWKEKKLLFTFFFKEISTEAVIGGAL